MCCTRTTSPQRIKSGGHGDARELWEQEVLGGNDIPLVEGHGNSELGCEPEREYNFNIKKRSKKHLRNDLRRKAMGDGAVRRHGLATDAVKRH